MFTLLVRFDHVDDICEHILIYEIGFLTYFLPFHEIWTIEFESPCIYTYTHTQTYIYIHIYDPKICDKTIKVGRGILHKQISYRNERTVMPHSAGKESEWKWFNKEIR